MPAQQIKKEQPYQAVVEPAYNCEYLDLNEMLAGNFDQDLGNMDWTNDQPFSGLELIDQPETVAVTAMGRNNMLTISTDCGQQLVSNQLSEPGLDAVDLQAADPNSTMQVDVSDWLDVIMPSTGLTPLSANAPVSFPSDPILTPKSQQEVLDLFNFVDADYPSDVNGLMNWDKLAEAGTTN